MLLISVSIYFGYITKTKFSESKFQVESIFLSSRCENSLSTVVINMEDLTADADLSLKVPLQSIFEEFTCPICFNTVKDCFMTLCGLI